VAVMNNLLGLFPFMGRDTASADRGRATQAPPRTMQSSMQRTQGGNQSPQKSGQLPRKLPDLPRIESVAGLPSVRYIHTAKGAVCEQPDAVRATLIAVGEDARTATILIDPAFYHQNVVHLDALRAKLRNGDVSIVKTAFAPKDLIASLYRTEIRDAGTEGGENSEEAKLFDQFIRYGLDNGATDVHFVVKGQSAIVKYRIDSELEPMRGPHGGVFTREQLRGAIAYGYNRLMGVKTNSHSAFNIEVAQSCMIPYWTNQKLVNLRYQSGRGFAEDGGGAFTVYIRFIDSENSVAAQRFQDLGYADDQAAMLARAAVNRKGLVLVAGITGSGKSTSLTFYVETMPDVNRLNVITVEDPVEKVIKAASLQISLQRSLNSDSGKMSFKEVQGIIVRADPDVIFQGEIRDEASGVCAQTLLQTGHQVLATLHTEGIMGISSRMTSSEIGFSMHTITQPKFWSLMVYQALLAKVCRHCAGSADETMPTMTAFIRERFRIDTSNMKTRRPGGCPHCNHRGVKGMTVAAEIYRPTRLFLQHLRNGDDYAAEVEWRGTSDGQFDSPDMTGKTVFEHALYKAYCGVIDVQTLESIELIEHYELINQAA
jgi:type II secretory ATPase GspE/PulE/Tfp pilus assembly ATPase PilB-like protein